MRGIIKAITGIFLAIIITLSPLLLAAIPFYIYGIQSESRWQETLVEFGNKVEASGLHPLDKSKTLAGIDKDKNGIRDDIDRFILKQSYTDNQSKAAVQYARFMQKVMTANLDDAVKFQELQLLSDRADDCADKYNLYFTDYDSSTMEYFKYISLTVNTQSRLNAFNAFDRKSSANHVYLEPSPQPCDE